jgi:glutamate-5-semialdehyde dehydrogenase
MNLKYNVLEQCENAKEAALILAVADKDVKNITLFELANDILMYKDRILKANKQDIRLNKAKLSKAALERLMVDAKKIDEMISMLKSVAKQEDPVGKVLQKTQLDKDLILQRISVPIGVIACIFESRPEVVVQISALAIKSGNAVLLKGGKEALNTNRVLVDIIRKSILDNEGIPVNAVQLLETREAVKEILKMDEFIDLIIPRGSNKFVKYIQNNTKIPVLGHAEGICHVYVDKDADITKGIRICYDAKCQYPAVCNAMETLLVHDKIARRFLPKLATEYKKAKVELRGDSKTRKILTGIKRAEEKDWTTEYGDLILSIKIVNDVSEAIDHINKYGSGHTDAIVTENKKTALQFLNYVDSSSVMWNASTRFSDGYRYGLGAEVGISTNKIHARGPVGLDGLMIYKYILVGNGNIVAEYVGKNAKRFLHKKEV